MAGSPAAAQNYQSRGDVGEVPTALCASGRLGLGAVAPGPTALNLTAPGLSAALPSLQAAPEVVVSAGLAAVLPPMAPAAEPAALPLAAAFAAAPGVAQDGSSLAERSAQLGAAFDGSSAKKIGASEDYFGSAGPLAPPLSQLEATARRLYERFLPRFYKPLQVRVAYGESKLGPGASHSYDPAQGHSIEVIPAAADAQGEVPSAFGSRGRARLQAKIEQLVTFVHEFAHALFDHAVRSPGERAAYTAYDAMTEGFAVTLEQAMVERLLAAPAEAGLSERDVRDLTRLAQARRAWLAQEDTHYAEGVLALGRLHQEEGDEGLAAFIGALRAERLTALPRTSPAYQLALGRPGLLKALLTAGPQDPARAGLEAFELIAQGRAVSAEQRRLAAAAIADAGPEGWRRVFARSLARVDRFDTPDGPVWLIPHWLRAADSAQPAFALAQLDDKAARELAAFLGEKAGQPEGFQRLFEKPGPTQALLTLCSRVESLPWQAAAKAAWDAALTRWLGLGGLSF